MMSIPYFTYGMIAITALVTFLGFNRPEVYNKGLFFVAPITRRKEYFRLVSSIFLHADWGHLLFNLFSFYAFGKSLEMRYGIVFAAIVYFSAGVGGGLLSLLIHRKNESYRAVGASGAVCGIIFASVFLLPGSSVIVFPLPIPIPAWLYAVLFILVSLYGIRQQSDMIGHEAHLGGALTGTVITIIFFPAVLREQFLLLLGVTIPVVAALVAAQIIMRNRG